MSNFDVPATYAPPEVPEIWNEDPAPVLRPRCVAGMRNGLDVPHPWSGVPLEAVAAGEVRVLVFGAAPTGTPGEVPGGTGPLGAFAFGEPAVLRIGDAVRVDGHLVGHICGFADRYVVIQTWHSFCGGELETGPATLLEVGGQVE